MNSNQRHQNHYLMPTNINNDSTTNNYGSPLNQNKTEPSTTTTTAEFQEQSSLDRLDSNNLSNRYKMVYTTNTFGTNKQNSFENRRGTANNKTFQAPNPNQNSLINPYCSSRDKVKTNPNTYFDHQQVIQLQQQQQQQQPTYYTHQSPASMRTPLINTTTTTTVNQLINEPNGNENNNNNEANNQLKTKLLDITLNGNVNEQTNNNNEMQTSNNNNNSSSISINLSGDRALMTNVARSRKPLTGVSSFV
jgi:hypothetical protein